MCFAVVHVSTGGPIGYTISSALCPNRTVGGPHGSELHRHYPAQHGEWWIGWVEEVPGVNSQGHTREELLDNLHDALEEALEMNRAEARRPRAVSRK